ncbi:MAG: ankyrin repeat domain-containing protein [Candidatus Latescibacteria bacterium]|nr:ankyrin repeat domain-containing protein [Candidatus Latescibacterota bacterium]
MANPPIFFPVFHGDSKMVKAMLEADGQLLRIRDAKNLTPLHVAASRGQCAVAQVLLDRGADVQGPSPDGQWTPLVWAVYRGHLSMVKLLLDWGADPTEKGGNPIHYAGQRQHKEICRLLVEHGAIDGLIPSGDPELTGLFRAAYSYDHEGVVYVLERRPDLANATDRNGRTALHEACTNGDTRTVRTLLRFGTDPAVVDRSGLTALDRAKAHRRKSVVKILAS